MKKWMKRTIVKMPWKQRYDIENVSLFANVSLVIVFSQKKCVLALIMVNLQVIGDAYLEDVEFMDVDEEKEKAMADGRFHYCLRVCATYFCSLELAMC